MSRVLAPLLVGVLMGLLAAALFILRPTSARQERELRRAYLQRRRRREWFAGKELFVDRLGSTRRGSLVLVVCFGGLALWCFTLATIALFRQLP